MRRYFFVALLVLALLAGGGCAKKPAEVTKDYPFPLSREDLDEAIAARNLQWQIVADQAETDTFTAYNLEDAKGVQLTIITVGSGEERKLQLTATRFAMFGSREGFLIDELPAIVELAGDLYGSGAEAKKVYKEFQSKAAPRNWEIQWPKRVGDNHYNLDFKAYGPLNFVIDNQDSYARSQRVEASQMVQELASNGIDLENGTAKQMANKKPGKREQFFLIQGHLESIKKVSKTPNEEQLHPNDCRKARLVDNTGSVEVFLFNSSLTEKELGEERNHYLMYYPGETPYFLIYISAPLE